MFGSHGERSIEKYGSINASNVGSIVPVYFTENEYSKDEEKLIFDLIRFFSASPEKDLADQVKDDCGAVSLSLDYQRFRRLCDIEEFYAKMEDKPKIALSCMSAAIHQVLLNNQDFYLEEGKKINIRLHNYPESMTVLKNLKAAYIACTIHGCKSRTFKPIRSSAQAIDFQKIRLQELLKSEDHEEGRVPRTVECELTEDLVDLCIPGDVATVTGIIRVINNYMDIGGGKSKGRNQGFYYLYIEAVSIKNSKSLSVTEDMEDSNSDARAKELVDLFSFSPRDLEFIVKFSKEHGSDVFRQILQSICPSIYGHELVKAGITLALFGGVRKHSMDRNKVPVRGDIHVIVVGDPGLGKSQLLQAAAAVSPRGAMVLADGGLCCIDEFDKMSAEHQALLEAMEQQCVSVAKAGLVASLSARTSVLAAANPVGGHYNRAKTVNENLKMSPALLSRFDLVFILLDKPDEQLDKQLSEHIMSLHAGYGESSPALKKPRIAKAAQNVEAITMRVKGGSLVSRLRLDPKKDADFVPLPGALLRKYISYARTYVFPRMSKPAAEILQKFYLQLRDRNTAGDGTPITARQLESLVRLTQARARVDLREEITVQDAKDAVEIMKESLYDKYVDEHGFVDFGRSGGMSQQKEAKRFLSALNKQSELQQKDCFSISEIYSLADRIGLRVPDIDTFVDNLNSVGYLLKKGPKAYQVLSSSYSRSQPSRSRC
uniref:DNA helicase n=1 Tax=Gossypium raimondii TaxID=29730 RepID=A0A0D2NSJ8_GOSRA|nr:hypothetical protein B456_002G248900 [Gossypium raimondii]